MFVINELTFDEIEEYDILNYNQTHSYESDDVSNYNCMSYAFNAFEWINPINFFCENASDIMEELGLNSNYKTLYTKIEKALNHHNFNNHFLRKLIIKRMITAFPDLRIFSSFKDLEEDEYGIAFATGKDDFHFIRYDNGIYSHKRGGLEIEQLKDEEEGFGKRYRSKIIYFGMKKGPVKFNEG